MYRPIRSGRLYEQIVEQIEQQVLDGSLKAGDRLPPERDLAGKFGVSRTAVREAIKALRQKGLIEVYPGRGTFITNQTSQALHHSLGLAIRVDNVGGVGDLIELRSMMEPAIAAKAAERATPEQIASMEQIIARMDQVLILPDEFILADFDFHMALATASQNLLVPTIMNSIVELLQEQRKRIFKSDGGQIRSQIHHRKILTAVKSKNPQAAYQAMMEHMDQVREDYEATIVTLEPAAVG